jgi:arylsulfatase
MNRSFGLALSLCVLLCLFVSSIARAADRPKPNIIVILVDDMGFSDIGCFGSEIPTPHLDALAADGLRFTQFYNTGRCCPTRAALLTGLYSHQAGVGHMVEDRGQPGYRGRLNDSCVTFAEVLGPAGYFTAMSGKWHVGFEAGVTPKSRGFDRSLCAPAGGFYQPGHPRAKLILNGQAIANDDPRLPKNWYTTDLWTDFGIKFIDESRATGKPFFLYLAYNAPHFPLQAPAEDIAKFRGKYKIGWDVLRQNRYEKEKQLGLIDPAWDLSPRTGTIKAWDTLNTAEQDRFDHIMSVYAACVYHIDLAVGRLVESLKERGVLDNTLIFFMSDNGGNAESGPQGKTVGDPTQAKSDWFCGESWANAENTPYRRYKHFNHEGGIASPFVVHWPAGIAAKDELRWQPAHVIDIMPTVVDVSGAAYPKQFKSHDILPMEGRSLVPAFDNKPIQREALFWEHEGNAAVRVGDWKLVRMGRKGPWELYDMKTDRTELHDLSTKMPDKAKELADIWDQWAERAHVKPYPNEGGKKANAKNKAKPEE